MEVYKHSVGRWYERTQSLSSCFFLALSLQRCVRLLASSVGELLRSSDFDQFDSPLRHYRFNFFSPSSERFLVNHTPTQVASIPFDPSSGRHHDLHYRRCLQLAHPPVDMVATRRLAVGIVHILRKTLREAMACQNLYNSADAMAE